MAETKEIQVIDFKTLPGDFSGIDVTDEALAILKEKYGEVPDCSTKEGYAIAKEGLAVFRTLRGKIEVKRKEKNSDAVDYKKRVDTEAKRIVDFVAAMEEPLKKARKAEDEAKEKEKELAAEKEKERVAAIEKDINTIRNVVLDCHGKDSGDLTEIIESLEATEIAVDRFAEHTPIAEAAKLEAVKKLEELREQALKTEKADEDRRAEDARLADLSKKLDDERIENERKTTIKNKIQAIKDRGAYDPEATAEQLLGRIQVLENTRASKEVFEEFTEEAHMAVGLALSALKDFHTVAVEKERLAEVAAEEAIKAEEEAANTEACEEGPTKEDPELPPSGDNESPAIEKEAVETRNPRGEFVDKVTSLFGGIPTPLAERLYDAIGEGEIPHVQLIGGE